MTNKQRNKVIAGSLVVFLAAGVGGSMFFFNSLKNTKEKEVSKLEGSIVYVSDEGDAVLFGLDNQEDIARKPIKGFKIENKFFNSSDGLVMVDNENSKFQNIKRSEMDITISEIPFEDKSIFVSEMAATDKYIAYYDKTSMKINIASISSGGIVATVPEIADCSALYMKDELLYYSSDKRLFLYDAKSKSMISAQNIEAEAISITSFNDNVYASTDFGEVNSNNLIFEFDESLKAINLHETNLSKVSFIGNSEKSAYIQGETNGKWSIKKFEAIPASTQILSKQLEEISVYSGKFIINISDRLSIVDAETLVSKEYEINAVAAH